MAILDQLDFLVEKPVYQIIFITAGIVGIFLGIDRTIESEDEESSILQIISPLVALVLFGILAISIQNTGEMTSAQDIRANWTILILVLFGIALIAKPFRKLPIAFVLSAVIGLGLLYLIYTNSDEEGDLFEGIPMKWLIVGLMVIVILTFIISFVQEQAMDLLLLVIGWGPLITVLSIILIVQGVTLIFGYPNDGGLFDYLPGKEG